MGFKKLPALRAREVSRVVEQAGFVFDRQKGSHAVYKHPVTKKRTVVPIHLGKTIKKPLLQGIVGDIGLTIEEFLELLKK